MNKGNDTTCNYFGIVPFSLPLVLLPFVQLVHVIDLSSGAAIAFGASTDLL